MAYIPIPTGGKTITSSASINVPIRYDCFSCGKTVVYVYNLKGVGTGGYHVLQKKQTKDRVVNQTKNDAIQNLRENDAALFRAFNVDHNYEGFHTPVKCPNCGAIQPWSGMPKPFLKGELDFFWWLLAFIAGLMVILTFMYPGPQSLLLAGGFIALAILPPAIRKWKINRAREKLKRTRFNPPVYRWGMGAQ